MRIVLVGGGGHASDVLGAVEATREHGRDGERVTVAGIVADVEIDERRFTHRGVRQIGDISDLRRIDASHYIVAVGYSKPRRELNARVAPFGLTPATVIHPRADIHPGIPVGSGSVILSGVRASPMAKIGAHVFLSRGCLIGHDCDIRDFATVLPGAAVSGEVTLGEACLIGSNAVVVQRVQIGDGSIVGAGAVVLRDVPSEVTVVGNPAAVLNR